MEKTENQVLACLGAFALLAFTVIFVPIYGGWVLSILWGWFMVPLFGLPALSIPAAIGVSLVAALLTHQYRDDKKDEDDKTKRFIVAVGTGIVSPLFTLLMGYIAFQFMGR